MTFAAQREPLRRLATVFERLAHGLGLLERRALIFLAMDQHHRRLDAMCVVGGGVFTQVLGVLSGVKRYLGSSACIGWIGLPLASLWGAGFGWVCVPTTNGIAKVRAMLAAPERVLVFTVT